MPGRLFDDVCDLFGLGGEDRMACCDLSHHTAGASRHVALEIGIDRPVLRCDNRPAFPGFPGGFAGFGGTGFGDVRDRSPMAGSFPGGGTVWVRVALDAGGNVTEARLECTMERPVGRAAAGAGSWRK